jgi:hypothetical protein
MRLGISQLVNEESRASRRIRAFPASAIWFMPRTSQSAASAEGRWPQYARRLDDKNRHGVRDDLALASAERSHGLNRFPIRTGTAASIPRYHMHPMQGSGPCLQKHDDATAVTQNLRQSFTHMAKHVLRMDHSRLQCLWRLVVTPSRKLHSWLWEINEICVKLRTLTHLHCHKNTILLRPSISPNHLAENAANTWNSLWKGAYI